MESVKTEITGQVPATLFGRLVGHAFWGDLRREPLGLIALIFLCFLVLVAIAAPLIVPFDPNRQVLAMSLQPPSMQNLAGTDEFGRDIFSRLVWGAQLTMRTVLSVSVIVGPIGLIIGIVAGYFGGRIDAILMRFTDIVLSFPGLVLALAFAAAIGPGLNTAIIAISLTSWPPIARLARAESLVIRNSDYVAAARIYGASHLRLLFLYVTPMCVPSVIVRLTLNMATITLTAASLGFLGLGAQPPTPEWGAMISSGRQYMLDHWWVAVMPGIAILLTSLSFNLLGDTLRDILDPRHDRA